MPDPSPRLLTPEQVAEELATSQAQVYVLIRRGDIEAIKLGGRGQWRIERVKLEEYLGRLYAETAEWVKAHPFAERGVDGSDSEGG